MSNKEKKNEDNKRIELEKLIQQSSMSLEEVTKKAQQVLPKAQSIILDYGEIKEELDKESDKIIKSISQFYLTEEMVKSIPYVREKIRIDAIMASSLLFQMKTAEHAIIKLLTEIDSGTMTPRNFEVLASLQRAKMEIVKHLAQFMVITETAYKNFHADWQMQLEAKSEEQTGGDEGGGLRTRGTKQLLKAMQKIKNQSLETLESNDTHDTTFDEE